MRARQLDLPLLDTELNGSSANASAEPEDLLLEPIAIEPTRPRARNLPAREEMVARAQSLASAIADELARPVRLHVTDNRATMVSFRRAREGLSLRVHHMFLSAPPKVVKALADYAGRGARSAGAVLDQYVRENRDAIRTGTATQRSLRLDPRGVVWNLQDIYDRVNAMEFDNRIRARIGWGRGVVGRRRRTIRMGVYDHVSRTIRIHPALDRYEVPEFFVEYIVFHEMLHQAIPCREENGRRLHHPPEFREREKQFYNYERAIAWERQNLHLLLGRPVSRRVVRPVD